MAGLCVKCGNPVSEDFMFCGSCGAKVEKAPAQTPKTAAVPGQPAPQAFEQRTPQPPEQFPPSYSEQPVSQPPEQFSSQTPEQLQPSHSEQHEASGDESYLPSDSITVDYEPVFDIQIKPATPAPPPPPPPSPTAAAARIALSVFLGVLCFAFILVIAALVTVRPANIPVIVAGADVTWVLEETNIGDIVVDGLNRSDLIKKEIDIYDIKELLKRENVAAEFGLVAEKYAKAIADGDFNFYMNSRDIVRFIKAIAPELYDELGIRLSDEDYDAIADSINNYVDLKSYSVVRVMEQQSVDVVVPHVVFSVYPLIIVSLLCALVIFNIILLHRKKVGNALLVTGIPLSVSGLVLVALGLVIGPFTGLIGNDIVYGVFMLASGMAALVLILGFSLLILGVAFIILFRMAGKARAKRQPKISAASGKNTWVVVGLTTNLCMLAACGILSLIFYLNI